MSTKVSVEVTLESLVEAITSLSLGQQRQLLDILEDQVFESEEVDMENNPDVVAEVTAARHAYETGDYQTIEEYIASRSQSA
ncbi:MAG: hypothetical protein ACFCU8_02900 [Thermosynechococcaceae cyanobacterium]